MQKSNSGIPNILDSAFAKTEAISNLLKKDDFDAQYLEKVADLYNQREKEIIELKKNLETDAGKEFVANNSSYWNDNINALLSLDSQNLETLKTKTNELGDKVRQLYKQKSVLIYSK